MVKIENNRIVGTVQMAGQFLHGSKDVGQFPVKVTFNSDVDLVVKHALKDAIIALRKRVKNRTEAEALATGITFEAMVTAVPKSPDQVAAMVNPEALSAEAAQALMQKLMESMKTRGLTPAQDGIEIEQ